MIVKCPRYTPTCDRCGLELPTVGSFADALSAVEEADWLAIPPEMGNGIYWEHYCPKCKGRWME